MYCDVAVNNAGTNVPLRLCCTEYFSVKTVNCSNNYNSSTYNNNYTNHGTDNNDSWSDNNYWNNYNSGTYNDTDNDNTKYVNKAEVMSATNFQTCEWGRQKKK